MSSTARMGALAVLLLALWGCDGGGPSGPSTGGSLRVTILGLPAGSVAAVTVSGPGGFSQLLTNTQTLTQLTAGTYTITAGDVTAGSADYSATPANQSVAINGAQASATVVYGTSTGNLTVNITGLGTSKTAAVTVSGPGGYSRGVNATTTLKGLTPGDYTIDAAPAAALGCSSNVPAPTTQSVAVAAKSTSSVSVSYSPPPSSGPVNLCIAGMYLVQSAQNLAGTVPLVQNRDAYLRVFVVADAANSAAPAVQVRLLLNSVVQSTVTIPPPGVSVPTAADESALNKSWNYLVPGSLIQPGLSIEAEVDPARLIPESNDNDNGLVLAPSAIRNVPSLNVTFLPVLQTTSGQQGNITDANKNQFIDMTRRMHPIDAVDVQVRASPLSTSTVLESDGTGWQNVLDQVAAAAVADGRYYYGVAKVNYASGVAGIAYVSQPSFPSHAALGWDALPTAAVVAAHELGHNWGRRHAPCGGPADLDPGFPDADGLTAGYGIDLSTNPPTLKVPALSDIMGYCNTKWISEYTYRGVLDYLAPAGSPIRVNSQDLPVQPSLLVWGHASPEGLVLEPAFQITTRPRLPAAPGPYSLEARGADGALLFAYSFGMQEVADLPGGGSSFAFAVPLSPKQASRLTALRLNGLGRSALQTAAPAIPPGLAIRARRVSPGRVAVRWDPRVHPMIMIRDPATGEVLSFARGGDVPLSTDKSSVALVLSNGVTSRSTRVVVGR